VVVLDITMPRLNGLEAAKLIRNQSPGSKLVILSQHEPSLMRQAALSAGASAYVTKSEVSRELTTAIESLISVRT
jgi:DNA-binding NarL/FixJ family response regulator